MNFQAHHKIWIENLIGRPLTPEDGQLELALPLPPALADYYALAGRLDSINQAHNRLLALECLHIEQGMLIFMEENQEVVYWGIREQDLQMPDPIVYQGNHGETIEWFSEEMRVSEWLPMMAFWQAVNGGYAYGAYAELTVLTADSLRQHYPLLARHAGGSLDIYGTNGELIALAPGQDGSTIWAAGRDEQGFQRIDQLCNIDWDYCYLDDLDDLDD